MSLGHSTTDSSRPVSPLRIPGPPAATRPTTSPRQILDRLKIFSVSRLLPEMLWTILWATDSPRLNLLAALPWKPTPFGCGEIPLPTAAACDVEYPFALADWAVLVRFRVGTGTSRFCGTMGSV